MSSKTIQLLSRPNPTAPSPQNRLLRSQTTPPAATQLTPPPSHKLRRNTTHELCQLLLSKIQVLPAVKEDADDESKSSTTPSPDPSLVSFNAHEITDLLRIIQDVEKLTAQEVSYEQQKSLLAGSSRKMKQRGSRRMSAYDHDKEMDSQTEAIGYDLDATTLKNVQHFTGMVEQDSVRHSSAHVIARLKHAVKHTIVIQHLKKLGSKEMITMLKVKNELKFEGSHELHSDLDNIDDWNGFNIFHLLDTFKGDRGLTVRSITVEIVENRHCLLTTLGVNQRFFLNYINKVS